jgi:hypothetical protein
MKRTVAVFLSHLSDRFKKPIKSVTKQNVSNFVKRMRSLDAMIKPKLIWLSKPDPTLKGNTYINAKHGEI